MNCKKFRTEIEEAGRTASLGAAASAHLASCASCRAFRTEREALRGLVASLARVDAPADFEFRLRARIARSEDESHAHTTRRTFVPGAVWLAVAGCLVLALGVFIKFRQPQKQSREAASAAGSAATVEARGAPPQVAAATPRESNEHSTGFETAATNVDSIRSASRAPRAQRREKFVLPSETVERIAQTQPAASQQETHVSDVTGSPIYVGTPIPLRVTTQEKRLEALFKDVHGAQRVVAIDPVTFGARGQTPSRVNMKDVSYTGVW
jgi:hypothetical protein